MKILKKLPLTVSRKLIAALLSTSLILSCGDPITTAVVATVVDAGVGGTGIVRGIITGFGSVFVNGVEFEIDDTTQFNVDGETLADQSALSIGMVVTINGTINADGITGTAASLVYDDEIEGPVGLAPTVIEGSNGTQKLVKIFDYNVTIDALSTHFKNTTFDTLAQHDLVEISGYVTSANTLSATLVKKSDDAFSAGTSVVELKGHVSGLTSTSFNLGLVVVNYSSATELDFEDNTTLMNGIYVEVKGVFEIDQSISAEKIEQEESDFSESDGAISLSGIVSDYVDSSNFKINGQSIDASEASELEPSSALSLLENGISVEVEGSIVGSVLKASSLELELNDIEISAVVSAVDANSIQVSYPNSNGSVTIYADSSTQFEDESDAELDILVLANIVPGDFVDIEASTIDNQIVASNIKRDEMDEIILQGTVDSFESLISVTILGVTYLVDGNTEYDEFDTAAEFFAQLSDGDTLRISDDEDVADGIADKISEDD